ncbi:glycoside hydrolase family 32 protein [Actinopolymorpha sp. B17G11]|uniref:glycoside hydrolase family 32 protein n=1 Tax=Actinopolymorpha sp. B17G11 TaxID=3160861 RepID=UPI0032E4775E
MSADHHFPRYHPRPPTGYVNDPNGPVRIDGRWHLYFQYTHDTAHTGSVVWGHASSADLVSWRYHRPAMSPQPYGADRNGCWSGNTVLTDDGVVAFYSGMRQGHRYQSVLSDLSTDGGESFGPPHQVVADPEPSEQVEQFRDPFVWREGGRWSMLVGAGAVPGGPSARLYTSDDLEKWAYHGSFATPDERTGLGDMWECPQLVSFGDHEALLVSAYEFDRSAANRVLAVTGRRSGHELIPERVGKVDAGPDFYAASVLREGGDGPIMWGWVTESRAADWTHEADWSGMISLPRTVSLTPDGRLASAPVEALTGLRQEEIGRSVPAQFEVELELSGHRGEPTRMSLGTSAGERLDVVVDWATGQVSIDRDQASRDPRAEGGSYTFDEPEILSTSTMSLRWFVDGSVGELFTGSGRSATVRFYPTEPPPWTLSLSGLTATDEVHVWRLWESGHAGRRTRSEGCP